MRQAVEALNEMDAEQLKRLFREVRQRVSGVTRKVLGRSRVCVYIRCPAVRNAGPAGQLGHAGVAHEPRLRAARMGALLCH